MVYDLPRLVIASSSGDEAMHSMDHAPKCPFEVEERKKLAKQGISHLLRRRTKLLPIGTHKEIEVAASLPLPLRGVEQSLTARRRVEQV